MAPPAVPSCGPLHEALRARNPAIFDAAVQCEPMYGVLISLYTDEQS